MKTTETAARWIVVTKNGRYTYTTNTGSNSITGYRIGSDGSLAILDADGKTADTGATPIDMALTKSSRLLYALAGGVPRSTGSSSTMTAASTRSRRSAGFRRTVGLAAS